MIRIIRLHRLAAIFSAVCFCTVSAKSADTSANSRLPGKMLEYTVGCALPRGVRAEIDGVFYNGSLGLAPGWRQNPLSGKERELVSSCLLARTNAFGVPVEISMRNAEDSQTTHKSLQAGAYERRRFSHFEGAFYGDLFSEYPQAYVCVGDLNVRTRKLLQDKRRMCSVPREGTSHNGLPISLCGFIITGRCSDQRVYQQNGRKFRNPIFVYLAPGDD